MKVYTIGSQSSHTRYSPPLGIEVLREEETLKAQQPSLIDISERQLSFIVCQDFLQRMFVCAPRRCVCDAVDILLVIVDQVTPRRAGHRLRCNKILLHLAGRHIGELA